MPRPVQDLDPMKRIGKFYCLYRKKWGGHLEHGSICLVETYRPRLREFVIYDYNVNKRFAVPLLDFNRYWRILDPQPIIETSDQEALA